MRQVAFLVFILTFIMGHVHAHVTEHPSPETTDFQFIAHHEAPDTKLTSGQGALQFKVLYTRDPFHPGSRRRNRQSTRWI